MTERKPWQHSEPSRHRRGYGRQHELIRAELLRDIIFCEECTRQGRKYQFGQVADHIVPLAKGGSGDRSNYQLLCWSCSNRKTALDNGRRVKRRIGLSGWPDED